MILRVSAVFFDFASSCRKSSLISFEIGLSWISLHIKSIRLVNGRSATTSMISSEGRYIRHLYVTNSISPHATIARPIRLCHSSKSKSILSTLFFIILFSLRSGVDRPLLDRSNFVVGITSQIPENKLHKLPASPPSICNWNKKFAVSQNLGDVNPFIWLVLLE